MSFIERQRRARAKAEAKTLMRNDPETMEIRRQRKESQRVAEQAHVERDRVEAAEKRARDLKVSEGFLRCKVSSDEPFLFIASELERLHGLVAELRHELANVQTAKLARGVR